MQNNDQNLYKKAIRLSKQGKTDHAIDLFSEIIEHDPQHIGSMYNRAYLFSRKNKLEQALKEFDKVLMLKPHYSPLLFILTYLNYRKNTYENAIMWLEMGIPKRFYLKKDATQLKLKRYDKNLMPIDIAFIRYLKGIFLENTVDRMFPEFSELDIEEKSSNAETMIGNMLHNLKIA